MKIAHWAKFYPPEWGGMERVTHDLASGMAHEGLSVTAIAFTRDLDAPKNSVVDGVRVLRSRVRWSAGSQPLSIHWIIHCFWESMRSQAILIHAPNLLALLPLLMLCCLRLVGKGPRTRLLMWHSDIIDKGMAGKISRPLEHLLALLSTHIISTSLPYAEGSPVLRVHRRKVKVIPLGIEPPPTKGEVLPANLAGFISSRSLLLSTGRLVPYKGFATLIAAVAEVRQDVACIIVGTGPLEAELRAQVRALGQNTRILLAGRQSAEALDALYRHASMYIMSSNMKSEAFGVVLLEAMSHGLPIVASDIPGSGVPWVAQNGVNALTVPPGESTSLADAISTLLENPIQTRSLAQAGRRRFHAEFTCSRMIADFMRLIRN